MSHVLVVDDEPSICWGFRELLAEDGHEVSIAPSAEKALELVDQKRPDAIVLDVRLPGMGGLAALEHFQKRLGRDVPVIVITAFGNLETAVRAVQAGAYDYLAKPFDLDQAARLLREALRARERGASRPQPTEFPGPDERLIGASPAMQAVFKQIALVAATDAPVLITGESGTGKEEVAFAIHHHSARRDGPFLPISLGALSPHLIESELFGHVKGAFTGAETQRVGLLELARGGSVFLDEIGDVSLPLQVKLLRAIERREVTPVGDARPRQADFRVLAATNRPLDELAAAGQFREDLLYRLSVFHIELPPLRERRDDVPLLARHFLRQSAGASRRGEFTEAAMAELGSRPWFGNVRELRNAVEHAAILAREGDIRPEHLPPPIVSRGEAGVSQEEQIRAKVAAWARSFLESQEDSPDQAALYDRFLALVEPPLLEATLAFCRDNRALAARLLGIHRSTLREKLRSLRPSENP
jgi:two-component system nitrogen regulation response regulator GlnG